MTSLPNPRKPDSHSNSKIARRDLEKWLPDEWNFAKNIDDDDSGYEWGEDWRVEIVENEQPSGAKFSIQSKVLKGKSAVNSNGIGTEIDITTINRLFTITYPVLMHYVDSKTQKSYVIWLDDWMAQQSDLSWRTKDSGAVTLRIPILPENELNLKKIEQIKQYVLTTSLQHGNDKVIDLINRTSKDHRIDVIKNERGTQFFIHALHDGAVPLMLLLDDQAIQSNEEAIDTGLPTPILGNVSYSNVPPLLMQLMQNLTMTALVAGNPVDNTKPLVLSLDVLDSSRKSLYKIAQINMQMIQQGRKIVKWQGTSQVDGVILSFDLNPEKPNLFNLQFDMTQTNDTPVIALNRMKFIQALQQGEIVQLSELTLGLSFGESFIQNLQLNIQEAISSCEIELAEIIIEIWRRLKILIEFPEKYNNRHVDIARIIKQIFNSGRVNALADFPDPSTGTGQILIDPKLLPNMIEIFEEGWKRGEENTIFKSIPTPKFDLFGHKILLGNRAVILHIVSIDEIGQEIITLESGEKAVEVKFSFDPSKSFTVYEEWCSTDDKEAYFPTLES